VSAPSCRTLAVSGRTLLALALALAATPPDAAAQEPPAPAAQPAAVDAIDVSPRGAFLRALALPGWGHASIGSYTRGGFYFATQTATMYTFVRARLRLNEVQDRVGFREGWLRDRLAIEGVTEPTEIDAALDADAALAELRLLQDSREQQQEDLIAFGIFVLFLSGADAYVSAHLSRFPEPLELEASPVGDGRYELAVKVRLPN
jgi:hypothetical protein